MIPEQTKQLIIDSADIVQVIGRHVKLKKAGANLQGLCPFHNEKTPSFSVNPARQFYHCFGCGAGGDAVKFVMELEKKTFPEALRLLADMFNIIIDEKEPDPEYKEKEDEREKLYHLNRLAADFYHLEKHEALNRFTPDEITQWHLGFAPEGWSGLLDHFKEKGVKEDYIGKSDLFKFSEKNKTWYDFFRSRIVFPIFNNAGRVAGFGGRALPGNGQDAKYLNSPDSDIYPKGRTLYGLNFARKEIGQKDNCCLVEGYTDVITLHTAGAINTVAPCGTALTKEQLSLIGRYSKNITLIYDGDEAGEKAARKNGKLAVEQGFNVYICFLPDGQDPDSFFKPATSNQQPATDWILEKRKDYILQRSFSLLGAANGDPVMRHEAINDICGILFHLPKTRQDIYIEQISKDSKLKAKLFADKLNDLRSESAPTGQDKVLIPENVDPNSFEKWGFYEFKNEYYFRTKEGVQRFSNFVMKPIFHITNIYDSRRIFELVNVFGFRVVVNMDMQMITSLQGFQKEVESRGNFMFWGQMQQLQKLKLKLYEETRTCEEIKNLGWQKEGFWAWANGIINEDGSFQEADEYGVVKFNESNYFIPAFSKIYIADKSVFLDERKFMYKAGSTNLREWMDMYLKVHGENAPIGFAFYLAALFRDHILYLFDNFPIMNLFGPKGSGKNTMAYSLMAMFGKRQTEFNIHNGTKPGLAKHLELFCNALAFVDEYKNSLDFDKIETLKSIYNAIGRSRMNMDKGGQKETTAVNQAVILAGQEMPTIDIALSSRVIFLQFTSKKGLTSQQKDDFERLQKMERDGLSHITVYFLKHRKQFVENYRDNYTRTMSDFMEVFEKQQIDDRVVRNMVTVCAAFRTMEKWFEFSFSYDALLKRGIEVVRNHNDQLTRSDEMGVFWSMMEAMFDENAIIDKWHFVLSHVTGLTTNKGKLSFPEGKRVLKLKFQVIAKMYSEHMRKRGEKPLPIDSLRYYLETSKPFIGIERACKFTRKDWDPAEAKIVEKKTVTSAYCFDYDMIGINMDRQGVEDYEVPGIDVASDNRYERPEVVVSEDKLPF